MKNTIFLLFATVMLGFLSCNNAKEISDQTVVVEAIPKGVLAIDWDAFGRSDPMGITNVFVEGNKMSISIKYNGGCKKHLFQLVGHKITSKSLPPQRSIKLFHNADGDDCRELIEETLVFDISDFAIGSDEIELLLKNYEKPISYFPLK